MTEGRGFINETGIGTKLPQGAVRLSIIMEVWPFFTALRRKVKR